MSERTYYRAFLNWHEGKPTLCLLTYQHGAFLSCGCRATVTKTPMWAYQGPAKDFKEWLGDNWESGPPLSEWQTSEPDVLAEASRLGVVLHTRGCRRKPRTPERPTYPGGKRLGVSAQPKAERSTKRTKEND